MSYRCGICGTVSQKGQKRKLHIQYRTVMNPAGRAMVQIAREIPVCVSCSEALNGGESLEELRDRMEPIFPAAVVEPVFTHAPITTQPPPVVPVMVRNGRNPLVQKRTNGG